MTRKILFSLLAVFGLFACGALGAVLHITRVTSSLGRLVELHQVEHLRRDLIISIQAVQADFYRLEAPAAARLDLIVANVARLDDAVRHCGDCHHAAAVATSLRELRNLVEAYKEALSTFITAAANTPRVERLKLEAAAAGNTVLILTEQMAFAANETLRQRTVASLERIAYARHILVATLLVALAAAAAVAMHLVRWVTRPVTALLAATRAITEGDLEHRVAYADRTEFGELARNFDAMGAALRHGRDEVARQQGELVAREWMFRTLSEFTIDWEHWVAPDGQLVFVSDSCREVTGYTPAEFRADPGLLRRLLHPDDVAGFDAHASNPLTPRHEESEFRIVTKDGRVRWLSHVCGPIFDGDHFRGRFSSNRDITERRDLEERLFQSQKMESLGLLAGGVAHDFNNLLTAILGYASLLELRSRGADEKVHAGARQITRAAERAQDLTGTLLAFSRKRLMQRRPVDLNRVVEGMAPLLRSTLGDDVELVLELHPGELLVLGDANQLEHLLLNLAANARDAMVTAGGSFTVRTAPEQLDPTQTRIQGLESGLRVNLTVTDTGVGIAPKDLPHIFEPFYTTKEIGKGTGLGLATVYGTVEQHRGRITVESRQGKGTTFQASFPALIGPRPDPEGSAGPVLPAPQPAAANLTVLLAEDNDVVRGFLVEALEERGHRVLAARDGAEAMALYDAEPGAVAVAVLDVVMPKNNGKEVHDHIRRDNPELPIIFVSGYTRDILTAKGIEQEGLTVLPKPLKAQTLLDKIEELRGAKARVRRKGNPWNT